MANSKTSLNGYEFGRSPKTQAPFWGGSSDGASIDDTGIYTDKTWSSKKISDELAKKAEASDLANYAKATAVYTKTQTYTKAEVDKLLEGIPAVDAYTKTEVDTLLADKADKSDTYTKSQVNNLIPDVSGLATKTELNSGLAAKADVTSVYTKSQTYTKAEVDELIKGGGTPVDAYTKAETDTLLDAKADVTSVYTKAQTDNLLADKANTSDLANYAKVTAVYTKAQTYTKAEVDDLISGATPAPVDAYTKSETNALLADYAKVTSVYTKSQTYTKAEVDDLIEGATPAPVDAYTKAQTDNLLADKANASDVYTKTQTDNLLADKANAADVYTKTQTDNLLTDKANSSDVYSKSQTYTKTEVNDLISHSGGGGAEIDDTTSADNKVWSSEKTRASLLKSAGLRLHNGVPQTWVALIRDKTAGSSGTTNAMSEAFSADYQYTLPNGKVTVTIMYENGGAGQSYEIDLTDIPWNDVPDPSNDTNYPSNNSRWKTIVASEDIFEICIGGNVQSSTYYYPYIFVRVPKGTYASSISLSTNLRYSKWQKAGSVAVINGYATDPTQPIKTYDITSLVSNSSASAILGSTFPAKLVSWFKRDVATVQKLSKFVIEATRTDLSGTKYYHKSVWNIKSLETILPNSTSQNMQIKRFVAEFVKDNEEKWIYDQPQDYTGTLYKVTETIPSTTGNVTGSKVADTTTKYDTLVFGYAETWNKWEMKLYV